MIVATRPRSNAIAAMTQSANAAIRTFQAALTGVSLKAIKTVARSTLMSGMSAIEEQRTASPSAESSMPTRASAISQRLSAIAFSIEACADPGA